MKTVAIVGSHPKHRDQAPWDNAEIDIWVFNGAPLMDWCKRHTAVFEMHNPGFYKDPLYSPGWWDFLRVTSKPVIMAFPDPEIQSAELYPLETLCRDLLPNIKQGDEPLRYFTSSPAYAIALAIYMGYDRIMLYGIELETNSEYVYQKPGVAWWLAYAAGRGIEVYLPENCATFKAQLYGYDDDMTSLTREDFEEEAQRLKVALEATAQEVQHKRGLLDACIVDIEKARTAAGSMQVSAELQKTLGAKFETLQKDFQDALARYAITQGQLADCQMWLTRMERMMMGSQKFQEVAALNAPKIRAHEVAL